MGSKKVFVHCGLFFYGENGSSATLCLLKVKNFMSILKKDDSLPSLPLILLKLKLMS